MRDDLASYYRDRNLLTDLAWEPELGGPLDWFDFADSEGRVLWRQPSRSKPFPANRSYDTQRAWLKDCFEFSRPGFFFTLYTAHPDTTAVRDMGTDKRGYRFFSFPLTDLMGLPGKDHATELAQLKGFLEWVDEQADTYSEPLPANRISLQWFRGGYNSRGLEWSGICDLSETTQQALNEGLAQWEEQPWFATWKKTQLDRMARLRFGPHMWLRHDDLRADRRTAFLRDKHSMPTIETKTAGPKP